MKTIACNSIKGGTGKSTLSIILLNALSRTGYKCLAIDMDIANHSTSFYFNSGIAYETIFEKNIFKVFTGSPVKDNILSITDKIDLLNADVRLSDFNNIASIKRLKEMLRGLDYDYIIIDTAPAFDNIIMNVFMASDILLMPVQQDIFNYQSVKYLLKRLSEFELPDLDIHIIMNQYEKPRTENKTTYSNQIVDLFLKDENIVPFINPSRISKSSAIKKYINGQGYRLSSRAETQKSYNEIVELIHSTIGVKIEGEDI
jgi:chromosome partitioning protein